MIAIIAYALGSIPFGLLLAWAAGKGDIRAVGSGNIGATNVLRVGGKKLALLTVFLDMLKGALAVLLAATFAPDMLYIAGFAAFVGHVFPLWLRFKGGKGVATGLGVMLALSPIVGGAMCAIWLLTASISRYSSLAALAAFAFAPVVTWMTGDWKLCFLGVLLGLVVFWRHRGNIKRLSDGSESKIRLKT